VAKGVAVIQGPNGISNEDVVRIPARRLKEFTMEILREADVPENGAQITADCLIETDLRGVYSHGVMRLPVYVRHLKKTGPGCMTARPEISVIREGEAYDGLVLPAGGYKGYALALMGCILGGVLTGASIGSEVTDLGQDFDRDQNVGHFVGALSIEKFIPVQTFKKRMDRLIKELKSSRRMKDVEKIYLPGEKEHDTREQNLRDGIPISRGVLCELNELGAARLEE
jgi:LDH2 family malate/lactate/ureidoglycolate dehydrogenase